MLPRGIIKPIDYETYDATSEPALYSRQEYAAYREMLDRSVPKERYFPQPSYSANEYMAHRTDRPPVGQLPRADLDALAAGLEAGDYLLEEMYQDTGRLVSPTTQYGKLIEGLAQAAHYQSLVGKQPHEVAAALAAYGGYSAGRDSGTSGAVTIGDSHYPPGALPHYIDPLQLQQRHHQQLLQYGLGYPDYSPIHTDAETITPPSDVTPAMPILDDVTKRSRNLLRDIGSRPLSDDMEKYFLAEGTVRLHDPYGTSHVICGV